MRLVCQIALQQFRIRLENFVGFGRRGSKGMARRSCVCGICESVNLPSVCSACINYRYSARKHGPLGINCRVVRNGEREGAAMGFRGFRQNWSDEGGFGWFWILGC